jgi:ATP-binding cassette, subfamily B, bacterial
VTLFGKVRSPSQDSGSRSTDVVDLFDTFRFSGTTIGHGNRYIYLMEAINTMRESLIWEERSTPHFILFLQPDSYASTVFEKVARVAEVAFKRGSEYICDAESIPPVKVYLAGWIEETNPSEWIRLGHSLIAMNSQTIWQFVSPTYHTADLGRAVLEIIFRSSPYARSSLSDRLLNALALIIDQDSEPDLSKDEQNHEILSRLILDKKLPRLFEIQTSESPASAEASFLLFLQESYGQAELTRFVKTCLMTEPELAVRAVYARPLDDLREDWLASLRAQFKTSTKLLYMLRRSLPFLRPHWIRVTELLCYMGLDLVFCLSLPLSTKYLYDNVIAVGSYHALVVWVIAIIVIFAVGSFASHRRMIVGSLVGELVLRDLRKSVFAHLQMLPLRFYARASTGDILSRITNDTDKVQMALGQNLPDLIFQMISLLAFSITLLFLNWVLGVFMLLVGIPVFAYVYMRQTERMREAERDQMERIGEVTSFIQENLSSQLLVKTFSLVSQARSIFEVHLQRLFVGSLQVNRLHAKMLSSAGLISLALRVLTMVAGALLVMRQVLSVGDLIAFVALITQALNQTTAVTTKYQRLQSATGAFARIQELMAERMEVAEDPQAAELPDLQQEIKLEHVTFRYSNTDTPVLRDVTLSIKAGSQVAVVGPSGSGKSTLIGLLLRLHNPTRGRVLFDDKDIGAVTLTSLRRQITIVPQDTFLFNMSIQENIALGREGADEAAVVGAAKAALVHDFVQAMGSGYQTVVGERGARLSGGQRQRLAIARALIRDPRLVILDEATSALDPATEADIFQTIERVRHGRTVIMITHRLTSVVSCDTIFVLDQGHVVEQGTHSELVRLGGLYQQMYEEQTRHLVVSIAETKAEALRLRAVPLFAGLGNEALAALADHLILERYLPGEEIVRQGEPGDRLYFIGAGKVDVFDGARRIRTMADGDYFGEIALLTSGLRTATVRAVTATQLYSLSKEDFLLLLEHESQIRQAVIQRLNEQYATFVAPTPTEANA